MSTSKNYINFISHPNSGEQGYFKSIPSTSSLDMIKIYDRISPSIQLNNLPHDDSVYTKYYLILLVQRGDGIYTTEDFSYNIKHESILLIDSEQILNVSWNGKAQFSTIAFTQLFMIRRGGVDICEFFPFLMENRTPPYRFYSESFAEYWEIFKRIKEELNSNLPRNANIIAMLVMRILLKLKVKHHCYSALSKTANPHPEIVNKFFQALHLYIENLLNDSSSHLKVKDFARLQNLPESYFSKVIRTNTGKPVRYWIQEKLLVSAVNLIENRELSIKQISFKMGYSNVSNFSAFVRKWTGKPPTYYRKNSPSIFDKQYLSWIYFLVTTGIA